MVEPLAGTSAWVTLQLKLWNELCSCPDSMARFPIWAGLGSKFSSWAALQIFFLAWAGTSEFKAAIITMLHKVKVNFISVIRKNKNFDREKETTGNNQINIVELKKQCFKKIHSIFSKMEIRKKCSLLS